MTTADDSDSANRQTEPFWRSKRLAEMTRQEWESLCDGCGRCCLNKIEYEDTGEIAWTDVACRLFDDATCRCRNYDRRHAAVPDCLALTADNVPEIRWLPPTRPPGKPSGPSLDTSKPRGSWRPGHVTRSGGWI